MKPKVEATGTKAESALIFINQMIDLGKTIYVCTAIKAIKITPSTFAKWSESDIELWNQRTNIKK